MIAALFVHPPNMDLSPKSYFKAVLEAHDWIKNDLKQILTTPESQERPPATIGHVHASLLDIEALLFGSSSSFDATLEGCCLYTQSLESRLRSSSSCVLQ